jgi:hypothetical protein
MRTNIINVASVIFILLLTTQSTSAAQYVSSATDDDSDYASQQPPVKPAPPKSSQDLAKRDNYLDQMLQKQQRQAEYWEYGWGAFNGGTMIYNAVQAANDHGYKNHNTDIVQAGESLIGLADVIFRPLPAFNADDVCPKQISTEEERLNCVYAKENLLERSAQRAHEPYEAMPHILNLAFNLGAGAIVWKVADTSHALVTAIPGEIIGEIQIWTQPKDPLSDYSGYKMSVGPMLKEYDRSRSPTTGLIFTFSL